MNATASRTATAPRPRPGRCCPAHRGEVLDGGPVQYRCPRGHRVQAADLNREVTR